MRNRPEKRLSMIVLFVMIILTTINIIISSSGIGSISSREIEEIYNHAQHISEEANEALSYMSLNDQAASDINAENDGMADEILWNDEEQYYNLSHIVQDAFEITSLVGDYVKGK